MRFRNLDGTTPDKSPLDILKWQVADRVTGKRVRPNDADFVTPSRPNDGAALSAVSPHATWIGHATWVLRLGGKLIATDPLWSERIQTVIKRRVAPGVALANVPKLDIVTVSHDHFDHLDMPTLRRIGPETTFVVPTNVGPLLRAQGLRNVIELGWFESTVQGDLRITLVPAQHWGMRSPLDKNTRLWGGFVYEGPEGVAYHAGDTALSELTFQTIRERAPRIDWAMLPIGAYEPQWFMQAQHMGPEEAVRAFDLLGAKHLLAMHWGTFKLTDEHCKEPPERLRAAWHNQSRDPSRLWILDVGETRSLSR
jgi:L-ascorbate metabolism protein UlaG (beta-lactamase superfamily)